MHLGIIGFGNIAKTLLQLLEQEPVKRLTVLVREAHREDAADLLEKTPAASVCDVVTFADDLVDAKPDLVAECAGAGAVADIVPRLLGAGISTVVVSIGALADDALAAGLRQAAEAGSAKLILPSGAIGGIDLLAALKPAGDLSVTYQGTKPPGAWMGTPAEAALDLEALAEPTVFFKGSARNAALNYPKNANVAATLALAGAGFEATLVELVADPTAAKNSHAFEVESPLCRFSVRIDNAASAANAKTSVATVYSLLREINRVRHSVVV
ncbi:aspartate dehydrogenase [Aestuariicoccus sp. MJ-SS9]|uniref:aspartate dehydrogenase n=1 Tax=Aestuariicoccus sp. MJ-SS9 TaxID=3079855 RepID=UPI00290E8833|nr:aspartate dehydrogenase [Aestuariicoccus sp. MJ-SS9]MDU8910995.1 aspartate dehydrogenase [Aestuariicoccus sp. MJ-SS9]